ncbi:MAG: hypothetical protein IAG13_05700 [Deltaproteobacteria bacterium]|nr:hypothetical protein [Nannocystaceae bacterium]
MFAIGSTLLAANLSLLTAPQPSTAERPQVVPNTGPYPTTRICHSIAADKTAVLSDNDDGDRLKSTGTSYASRASCDRFVADFRVLPGANAQAARMEGSFRVAGDLDAAITSPDCDGVRVDVRVYKKAHGTTAFATYSHHVLEGEHLFVEGIPFCKWTVVDGAPGAEAMPNGAGTETYRVSVKASKNGAARPVVAWIRFIPIIS